RAMLLSLPADEPDRSHVGRALAQELVQLAHLAPEGSRGWLIEEINGVPAAVDALAPLLLEAGFAATAMGLQLRVARGGSRRFANDSDGSDADKNTNTDSTDSLR
ncbi:MAG: hypothetical protein ACRD1H_12035, partial [Vicinamibacterales bacterium]